MPSQTTRELQSNLLETQKMLNAPRRVQKVHGFLCLSNGTLIKTEMVMARCAVANAGKVKPQDTNPIAAKFSRNSYVNAPRTDTVHGYQH